jgi:hypothetical protein
MFKIKLSNDINICKKTECHPNYDYNLDDSESVLRDICEIISDTDKVHFCVSAFNMDWPVDIETDLLIVISQIPAIIIKLKQNEETQLDFYEQGIERSIKFQPQGEDIVISCFDLMGDRLSPPEQYDKSEIIKQLVILVQDFIDIASKICPAYLKHPLLKNWLDSCSIDKPNTPLSPTS